MTIRDVIKRLHERYEMGQKRDYVLKPLSWALYQTWKDIDAIEKPRKDPEKIEEAENCKHCRWCRLVGTATGWSFYGCDYEPYHGKWIAEIKECPKESEEQA